MIIDYNMSKEYCADWSSIDAIREMVQNAIDSGNRYDCVVLDDVIYVTTYDTELPLSTLMLGQSVKAENSIGKYGEGYKIGMLVLTRNGHVPDIITGNYHIGGVFSENQLGVESFKVQISEYPQHTNSISFSCKVGDIDLDELRHKIPAFTDNPLPLPKTIDVLKDRQGEIYVNGLYVTKENLVFGYNFAPNKISLNRDRNMVDGVYWQLATYYANLDVKHAELIFDLVERDAPDVQDLSYKLHNKELMAELARLFFNKYGDGAKIAKPGTSYFGGFGSVSTSTTGSRVYSKCGIEEATKTTDPNAPDQVLSNWLETNKSKLRRDTRKSFETVVLRSKGWKKADIL